MSEHDSEEFLPVVEMNDASEAEGSFDTEHDAMDEMSVKEEECIEEISVKEEPVDHVFEEEEEEEDLFNIGDKSDAEPTDGDLSSASKDRDSAKEANAAATAAAVSQGSKMTTSNHEGRGMRRHSCYVGNLTWWTTDSDIDKALNNLDITDLAEVRFHENRVNGQSKGFAVVSFLSDTSVRKCLESFSTQSINGVTPIVMPYSKQSLISLEAACAKKMASERPAPRPLMADDKPPSPLFLGTIRLDTLISNASREAASGARATRNSNYAGGRNNRTSHLPSLLSSNINIPMPSRMAPMGHGMAPAPPQVMVPPPVPNRPPPGYPVQARPPHMGGLPPAAVPPPGSHINPNFYPGLAAGSVHLSHFGDVMSGGDPDYEEALNRNRIVASSAITRAVADAATGDFGTAIETLVTAITMLRGSKVVHDERNRILVSSLQDTLRGIEKQSYGSGRRSRPARERSHNSREYRKRRTDRSRSRSRERHAIDTYSPRRKRY